MAFNKNLEELPHDTQAEQSVIGAILIEGQGAEILTAEDFYHIEHQKIFKVIEELRKRGQVVDLVLLNSELAKQGLLEEVGGTSYLMQLAGSVPNASNIDYYARIVKEKAVLRKAIALAEQITKTAFEGDINNTRRLGMQVSGLYIDALEKPFNEVFTEEDYIRISQTKRWTSENLYKLTHYVPFMRGENIYIAGKTSTGKTQIALNLAIGFLQQGAKVGYLSMELGREQLLLRLINWETGDDLKQIAENDKRLVNIDLRQKNWWELGMAIIKQDFYKNFYFTEEYFDLDDIENWIESHSFDVVFIDYVQLIKTRYGSNRNEQIEYIARELRRLSKKRCIVVLSQFNRARNEDEDEIDLSRLRDSGALEQTATSIVLIRRDQDEFNRFYYAVAKNQTFGLGALTNGWKRMILLPSGKFKEDF